MIPLADLHSSREQLQAVVVVGLPGVVAELLAVALPDVAELLPAADAVVVEQPGVAAGRLPVADVVVVEQPDVVAGRRVVVDVAAGHLAAGHLAAVVAVVVVLHNYLQEWLSAVVVVVVVAVE